MDMSNADRLASLSNEKLLDVVRNHRQYAYSPEVRDQALALLRDRGYELEELRLVESHAYERIEELAGAFFWNSTLGLIAYLGLLCSILAAALAWNAGSRVWVTVASLVLMVAIRICRWFLIRAFLDQVAFYEAIHRTEEAKSQAGFFLVDVPLYFIMYFQLKKKMKEALRTAR
jgi:hypothetical protein